MSWPFRLLLGAVVALLVVFVFKSNAHYLHERIVAPIVSSSAMRWYRCVGVDRPLLDRPGAEWTLQYSWSDGYGPGSVAVEIGSNGRARMQAWSLDRGVAHRSATLSASQVRHIAALVDETGLLCQTPEAHPEYLVEDRGTYFVSVQRGGHIGKVFVDECHEIPDGAAFGDVLQGLSTLRTMLGEEVAWGPFGSVALEAPCRPVVPRVWSPQPGR